jgi:hypothetical protein
VVYFVADYVNYLTGNLGSGCLQADMAKHVDLSVTNNACPNINAQLPLM